MCFEWVRGNFELACVAISLFFAMWWGVGFGFRFESGESSLGSRWSLGMPILVGSAVAINLQTAGGQGLLFTSYGVRRRACPE
jgi:hypothetical protein